MRPSLDSFKQASSNAFSKAQLMVGLNQNEDDSANVDVEMTNNNEGDEIPASRTSSFRGLFGRGDDESSVDKSEQSSSFVEEAADLLCPELTFQQRLIGFASCFTIAYMITFMSFKFFVQLIEGSPIPFAVNYSIGNALAMSASGFLCGPKRQFKNMFDNKRRTVTIVYLSCLASTLIVVFIPIYSGLKLLTLILLLISQCGANIWYSLSYIPYGRRTALKLAKRCVGLNNNSGNGFMGLGNNGELS
mmetsp:Transcript_5108/g.14845  ORF Transcript_5108/g.14845 Transcript_5108/m.14845 type:complete len:247 (+) Transcript_5108:211-951(+)